MNKEEILIKLKKAAEAYYNGDDSELTDEEYDNLNQFAESQGWLKEDDVLNDGANINLDNIVQHNVPMQSLKKAKTYDEIKKFFKDCVEKGAKHFVIEPKLDGQALTVKYSDRKVSTLSTRGNGQEGENVTYILNSDEVEIKNIEENISSKKQDLIEIRGELICTHEDLIFNNKQRGENFKNERNAISGITKKAKLGLGYKAKTTFVPYFGISSDNKLVLLDEEFSNQARFLFSDNVANNYDDLISLIKKANVWRKNIGMPTDGIVIKPLEEIKIGNTGHHPKEYIAFKYPNEQKITKVIEIEYTIGKTGKLTPNIKTEEVVIDGVNITRFTGNNLDWLKKHDIRVGSKVLVTRSNDVIPMIIASVDNTEAKDFNVIKNCPSCNTKLEGNLKSLRCPNINCPSVIQFRLEHIISKDVLDIDGLSSEYLKSIPNLKNVEDIISITLEELKNIKSIKSGVSLGDIRATKIYNQIQDRKNDLPEYKWFNSFNINGFGNITSKLVLENISLIDLYDNLENSKKVLNNIKGIGKELIKNFEDTFYENKKLLNNLIIKGVKIIHTESNKNLNKGIIVHTGSVPNSFKNRKELQNYLENKGYKLASSVNKKSNYLLTEEKDSISNKMKKAIELSIPIVNWQEFIKIEKL